MYMDNTACSDSFLYINIVILIGVALITKFPFNFHCFCKHVDSSIYGLNLLNLVPRVAMKAASLPNASLSSDDHYDFFAPSASNITAGLQLDLDEG